MKNAILIVLLAVSFSSIVCYGIEHPMFVASHTVDSLNKMNINRFVVQSVEPVDDNNLLVHLVGKHVAFKCTVIKKPVLGFSPAPVPQSFLGEQVMAGKQSFMLAATQNPRSNITCEVNTADFDHESVKYIDFIAIDNL